MNALAEIANYLQIDNDQIKSVAVWARVYFVQFVSGRPTFVSKKEVNASSEELQDELASDFVVKIVDKKQLIQKLADVADALMNEIDGDSSGLPHLSGSYKQVNWAHALRSNFVHSLVGAASEFPELLEEYDINRLEKAFQVTIWNTSASFWINNRDRLSWEEFINEI